MNILLVKYLPSGENSNTKKILDAFLAMSKQAPTTTLDLEQTTIPVFNQKSMAAYYKRNYRAEKLTADEAKTLQQNDDLIKQLKAADVVVLACPMHNFGLPGIVKGYIDSVMFKGETFEMGKKLMAGKKAIILYSSGGQYPKEKFGLDYPNWDSLTMNVKINFAFMGFDETEVVSTTLGDAKTADHHMNKVREEIAAILKRWNLAK